MLVLMLTSLQRLFIGSHNRYSGSVKSREHISADSQVCLTYILGELVCMYVCLLECKMRVIVRMTVSLAISGLRPVVNYF